MRFAVKLSNISFSSFRAVAPGLKMHSAAAAQHRSTSEKRAFCGTLSAETICFILYFELFQDGIFDSVDPAEGKVEVNPRLNI